MNPRKVGRYEIKAELGRGGMAVVYRAHDPRFRRDVAIKVLPREFLHDPSFRARFEREAQAIAALEHGAIVPVYDSGEEEGQPYLVMRFMPSGSLADRLRDGPLPLEESITIIDRIAGALDFAHQEGIVHRDVKPANIMFDRAGLAYLTDFGIVKLSEATAQLTGSGIIGTPAYMAPEMAHPGGVTPLVDVYALGVTLFEMLAGDPPFEADTPMGLLMAHLGLPVPGILGLRPDLPPGVQGVVERALAKDPADRYPSAGEMAACLRAAHQAAQVEFAAGGATVAETVVEPEEDEQQAAEEPVGAVTLGEGPDATLLPGDTWEPAYPPEIPTERLPPPHRAGLPGWALGTGVLAGAALLVGVLALAGVFGGGPATPAPEEVPAEEEPATEEPATEEPAANEAATVEPMTEEPVEESGIPASAFEGVTRNADWTLYTQNFDGVEMALVPAGCFQMGSEDGDSDEQPVHEVCFNEPFWIDVYEVTNAAFAAFLNSAGNQTEGGAAWLDAGDEDVLIRESGGTWIPEGGYEDHPAIELTWYGAAAYCDWLGKRLPTEAEWEYAARGPDGLVFPWGNVFDGYRLNYCDTNCESDWAYKSVDDGYANTAPVGTYPEGVSWVGAYDMSGNVWEWVNDWYGDYPSGQQVNPPGPDSGTYPVLRGGSWYGDTVNLRAADRYLGSPDVTVDYFGLRCALSN